MDANPIELWAGVECTVNRVADAFFDQLARNGHADRISDLDRFAELGIRTLRYPILWERTAPEGTCDFRWTDARMARMRELGIRPIVGLVHHGSGPAFTSLVDRDFPEKLAHYAEEVAKRYPDALDWTPVNEPLTTARFSGLYGHWYPHGRDSRTFVRALVQECRGIVRAMQAIRAVQPAARLVQTEDLGRVFSTPLLAYQAAYENVRRWLSLDLLFGRVDRAHPLWQELLDDGIAEDELRFFLESDVRPDVVGLNYYVTSDRYLDERRDYFPRHTHGGNGRHRYADVEAVRVLARGIVGHEGVLLDAWERYRTPVAITEAHLGCTREEQVRWLVDAWEGARAARARGADVRAVTAWSLLGAFDWNTLLVRQGSFYEPGAFDVRAGEPRPTAIARAVRALCTTGRYDHALLDAPGWWRRPERILHPIPEQPVPHAHPPSAARKRARAILVTGAAGGLAQAIVHACEVRGLATVQLRRADVDVSDPEAVARALERVRPWAVINAAGMVQVPGSPADEARLFRENAQGARVLAAACAAHDLPLVTFSSEHVFDGQKGASYHERDLRSPVTPYGRSKAQAEENALVAHQGALVVRTGTIFGPWGRRDFVRAAVQRLLVGQFVSGEERTIVSPTYAPDLAAAALDLLVDGEQGLWNVANAGAASWLDVLRTIARIARLDRRLVVAVPSARPADTSLTSERGIFLPAIEDGLDRYFREHAFGELARSVA